ncbi:hypothetical protein OG474_30440 [Kribbella sp. NBC_01505]|uniref:hypothetical protein n=1 Tax=Kribbella sp. NBC_01505 TaxID=2903580 RepID=UPI00386DDB07
MTALNPELLAAIGSGVVGGGVITGLVNAWVARKRVPAETDSIIVTGAEKAVVALQAVLQAETARADRAEAEADRERQRRVALEDKLDLIQAALDEARSELHALTATD